MDMQLYLLHVVPIVVIVYGVVILFMHPPIKVIWATLAGGLLMALLNIAGDLLAIHASVWYYNGSGLIAQLPLPFYTTPLLITGGLAYLLIWRFWRGSSHWLAWVLLAGVPIFGVIRDYLEGSVGTQNSFLIWKSPLALLFDIVMWLVMFFAGYLLFHSIAPVRTTPATQQPEAEISTALEKQK
jgi:hypothetical protein